MPSGRTHDRLTSLASLALFPAAVIVTSGSQLITVDGLLNGAIAALCCLVSGIWLSPDVDVQGYLDRRYGMLQFVWWPYYSVSHMGGHYRVHGKATHRSHLSHSPLIGTASKVLYLAAIAALVLPFVGVNLEAIALFIQGHSSELLVGEIGLEVGAAAHYIADWVWSELH
jgi:uncharacterized metal-binding protein